MHSASFSSRVRNRRLPALNLVASSTVGALVVSLLPLANAFSFNIDDTPTQCQNMSVSITGGGGTPPYRVLIIPFGGTPLPNNIEARRIVDQEFDGDSRTVSFQLKYPALSQFVVVVSDSQNFGAGGTSGAATVAESSDSSCFDATKNVQASWFFNTDPLNQFVQCQTSRLWWDPSTVQGTPRFYGVIPGGNSFNISVQNVTPKDGEGVGFDWTPNIRGGTTLIVGAGDDRGLGSGGSVTYIVSTGNGVTSCLDLTSPSSTAGSPAGGSYPTSTSEASQGDGGDSSNTGAIAGGVVAGLVVLCAFVLVLIFVRRTKQKRASTKERPDLFMDNEHPSDAQGDVARLAPVEPYIVPNEPPPPSEYGGGSSIPGSAYGYGVGTGAAAGGAGGSRRMSSYSLTTHTGTENDPLRPGTPMTSSAGGTSRKGGPPPVMRPVNIIQHEDAGASLPGEDDNEPETVELPPAYTHIRNT